MSSTPLVTPAAGSVTAPAAGVTIVTLAAPPVRGLYRATFLSSYQTGTLGPTEQAGVATMLAQDSGGNLLSPIPTAGVVGIVTEYDIAVLLDGSTGIKVVQGAAGGSSGVVYSVLAKLEFISSGFQTF